MLVTVVLLVEALSIRRWEQLLHTLADFDDASGRKSARQSAADSVSCQERPPSPLYMNTAPTLAQVCNTNAILCTRTIAAVGPKFAESFERQIRLQKTARCSAVR